MLVDIKEKEELSASAHRWIRFPAAAVKQLWRAGTGLKEGKFDEKTQAPHEQ